MENTRRLLVFVFESNWLTFMNLSLGDWNSRGAQTTLLLVIFILPEFEYYNPF